MSSQGYQKMGKCPPQPCPPQPCRACNQFNCAGQQNPFYCGYNRAPPVPPVPPTVVNSAYQATYTPATATVLAQGAIVPFSTPQVSVGSGITSNGAGTFTLQPGSYFLTSAIATATPGAAFNVTVNGMTYLSLQFVMTPTLLSITTTSTVSINVATMGGITLTGGATNVISIFQF